ncbi:MAG: hypothetical protein M1840_007599 [Geoglossum simile]|nr:MAG: hypothetical protein M1840_007599 [Geoglossum simile]
MANLTSKLGFKEPRIAIKQDIPRITEILLAALLQDDYFLYLHQHREKFPDDQQEYWCVWVYRALFNPRYQVLVLELADETGERVGKSQTISFAIWERKGSSDSAIKWESERRGQIAIDDIISPIITEWSGSRRDVSTARQEACIASLQYTDDTFDVISQDRLQIELICTDPNFQRCGAASKLVQWGKDKATMERAKAVSVAASSLGQILYRKHSFSIIKWHSIQVKGEEEMTNFAMMIYHIS